MKEPLTKGKIAFINHEKKYAIIEYEQNGKKKTVNASIDVKLQKKLKDEKLIRKTHHFLMGDTVEFKVKISDRGDRMIATNVQFLYNDALDVLVNKAKQTNKFLGYLKEVDEKYYVKEIDSYLFFPLLISPWQLRPPAAMLNEQVTFALENTDKKEKIAASLLNNEYIPEFHLAVKAFKAKTPVEAEVIRKAPHAMYVSMFDGKIQAKIPLDKNQQYQSLADKVNVTEKIMVLITHLSRSRIIIEPADTQE